MGRRSTREVEHSPGTESKDTEETSGEDDAGGVSRRDALVYGGGTYVCGGLLLGGVWYGFFRESFEPEEEVVREYVDALDRAHFYTVQELFHEDAPDSPPTAADVPDVAQVDLSAEETEIVDRDTDPDLASVEAFALVRTVISLESPMDSDTLEVGIVVAQNEAGEWKIWSDKL